MTMPENNASALRGCEASVLTDDERTALRDASWASFAKANALLHGAADVIEELHCHAGFDGNDMALQALVVVFCERCTRRGLNPHKEFASWLADEMWWRNGGTGRMTGFPREGDGEVAEVGARAAWLKTKDRALRALVAAAVGTREEQNAYERDLRQSGGPGANGS